MRPLPLATLSGVFASRRARVAGWRWYRQAPHRRILIADSHLAWQLGGVDSRQSPQPHGKVVRIGSEC